MKRIDPLGIDRQNQWYLQANEGEVFRVSLKKLAIPDTTESPLFLGTDRWKDEHW